MTAVGSSVANGYRTGHATARDTLPHGMGVTFMNFHLSQKPAQLRAAVSHARGSSADIGFLRLGVLPDINDMKNKKSVFLFLMAAMLGIYFGQADIFGVMQSLLILFFIGFIGFIALISGLFNNNSRVIKISGLMILLAITSCISTSSTNFIKITAKNNTAEQIILDLAHYKDLHGSYPNDLQAIGYEVDVFSYRTDSATSEFRLMYLVDGWHFRDYSSKTENWREGD
ncbi:hypothetical protein QWY85_00700 [Neolewinella lacunae]|uniref:Uncharacterized protein n=1 Tax=Neolewinella lacunae TaxID=1517758 RepID=A0A923PL78_9BACT|nr:hypothetical protein [Neolewinella lacunae]MBC6995429.1 hypothetical protein [Neolewinella lacunae]MDN3633152.1 hypothetical protein [Neolewinella lacunae]